jgi:hypothetical protein
MPAPAGYVGVDYATFGVGAALFPIVSPGTNTSLQDADPALYYALDFWANMIRVHVGARLIAEAQALNLPMWTNSAGAWDSVVQQVPYDVGPFLTQDQVQFPILAAYRTGTRTEKLTAGYYHDTGYFSVAYVLPPINAGQSERMLPLLRAVESVLRNRTDQAWDPNYTPPGGSGPLPRPFAAGFAYVEEIGFGAPQCPNSSYGRMPGTGNLWFPTLLMHGYIIERDNDPPLTWSGRQVFAGGDIEVDLADGGGTGDGTDVPNLINVSTQQAPTITSLSVTTGTHLGGTSVTITGTLFLTGPNVLFGNVAATGIVWNSATSITCTTPAMSGSGTLPVSVINRDGQVGTLTAAFTFT